MNVDAMMNSFHAVMNENSAVTARPGRASGKKRGPDIVQVRGKDDKAMFVSPNMDGADISQAALDDARVAPRRMEAVERIAALHAKVTDQEILDLQVWFNLTWFGYAGEQLYPEITALKRKGANFTEDDKQTIFAARERRFCAAALSSRAVRLMHFKGLALKD